MTAVVEATSTHTPPDAVAYWYQPDHARPAATFLCYCGARAAGRTHYGHGLSRLPDRTLYHCRDHLPTTSAEYSIAEVW